MTTSPTHPRQITALALTIAAWLTLTPGGAFSSEPIQPTASMAVARRGHTATVLADGRVLIVGGLDASGPLAAAEVFDPAQKTFSLAGNLVNARYGHTATLLTNGRVLIAGGQDASGPLASAEIFDPADTNGFRLLPATMGAARAGHTATVRSDGTVLLAGGDTAGTAEIFDPATESFYTPLLPMATPRSGHTATPLADDNLFLVGGGTASIELFNAASNSFSLWPNGLSQIRSGHSSIPTTDGKLLVIGGDPSGTFETFDPTAGSSLLSLSLGTPSTTANLLANNQILVLGPGVSGLFDETTDQLSPLVDTNATLLQLSGHTATELPTANKQILVAGGIDTSNNLLSSATLYNPASIATDASDYPPFSWVNIYGSGFLPNEIVTNQVEEIVGPAAGTNYAPWGVTADTNGAFTTLWQVFSDELLDTTLKLTAVGQTSGLKAVTEFTDAGATTLAITSVGPATYGSSFSVTVESQNNGGVAKTVVANTGVALSLNAGSGTLGGTLTGTIPAGSSSVTINGVTYSKAETGVKITATRTSGDSLSPGTSAAFTVGPKTLTVNGITAANKIYDGTTSATLNTSGASLSGVVSGDTVTLNTGSATGVFSDKNVGTGKTVTVAGLTLGGANAGNYTLTQPSTTANITTRSLTVTATGVNKIYDGTTTASVTLSDNRVAGDTITDNDTSASFGDKNVGTGKTVSVSGISISGTDAGNYQLSSTTASTTANITARALTVTATGVNRVYDGTVAATVTLSDNRVGGDVFTDSFTTATFATKTVANGKTVSVSGISISGTDAGNYTFNATATTTANITAFALTITATGVNKVYNANSTATVTLSDNRIGGDVFTDSFTAATFANKNVGNGKTVSVSGISIAGTDAANYTFNTTASTTANITTATLTVSGITANNKPYDGNTTATLNTGSAALVGKLTGDTVNLSVAGAAGTFSDTAVGTGKTVTVSGLTISGTDASNYILTQPTTTANITAKALTVTGITANNKVYDRTTTATLNVGGATLNGVISGDTVTLSTAGATGAFADKTVANGKTVTVSGLTISGSDASNYTLTQPTTTANITAVTLTVTGITASNKIYDRTTTATLNVASAALVGVISGDTVTLSTAGATGAFADKTVANGKTVTVSGLTISGTDAANYTLTQPTTTADITAKGLAVSGITASNKVYDGNATATLNVASAALVGVVSGDTVTLSTAGATGAFSDKTVANGKTVTVSGLTIGGGDAGNYSLTQPTTTANITAKGLTVTGITASDKIYNATTGATLSTGSAALVGVVIGDTVNLSTASATGTFSDKNVASGKTVAVSGLTISGADSGNYSLTQPTTTASITALGITGSITANNRIYDGTTAATIATRTLSGVVLGDSVSHIGGTATFADKNVGTGKTVTATGLSLTGTDAGNYTVNSTATTTANISARALTVSATGVNKAYDGTTTATVSLSDNRVSGDVFTDSYVSASFANKSVGTGKTVSVSGISISGADAGNYTANTTATTSANITALALTVTATGVNKVYDATTAATVTLADNRISGDLITDNFASATFASKSVGTGKAINVTGISITGTDAGNYTLQNTAASASADITQRPLTVTATGVNKIYDGNSSATVNLSDNMLPGDIVGETFTTASFADKNVGTAKPVTVTGILINGADASNYSQQNTIASTTANITPKALIITVTGVDKVYDGTTAATVTLGDNRLSGDVLTDSYTTATFADKDAALNISVSVSGISISGPDAGNYTFNSTATTSADITPKTITASAVAANKVYDGTTIATIVSSNLTGVVAGDGVVLNINSANFSDRNVGNGKTVTVILSSSLGGQDHKDYTLASTTITTTADITARALTVSATGVNKIYDGTTAATVTLADNRVAGDVFTDSYTSASFADKNVGTDKAVTVTGISISGTDAGNYTFNTTASTTANITARSLTVTATGVNRVYDGTTAATVTLLDNRVSGDIFTDSYTGASFVNKNVGTGKIVSVSGISISGTDASNYALQNTTAATTANITARALIVNATGSDKVYDGTTSATVTLSDNRVAGDVFTDAYTGASFADKNVGTGKTVSVSGISISGTDAGNYTFNTTASATANITARALTVTATGVNKAYDGSTTATVTLSDNRVSGDVFTDSYTSANFADKNVGTAKTVSVSGIGIGGTDAGNYTVNATASTTADITARALHVTATAVNKVYDGNTTATVTLSDDRHPGDVLATSYSTATFDTKNVGVGKTVTVSGISISGTDAGNYTFNTTTTAVADITARALTVSAHGMDKIYDGTTLAAVTLSDDKVSGDNVTDSYTSASFADKNVGTAKPVSVIGISISGTDAGNYTFNTTATTSANITPLAITGSVTASDKVYDDSTAAIILTRTLVGQVLTDDVSYFGGTATFADKNVGNNKVVTATGLSLTGADAGNYTVNSTATTTASITALAITGSITAANKTYDATTAATITTRTLAGVLGSDDVSYIGGSATFSDKNVANGKTVTGTGLSLSGTDAGNYSVNDTATTTADITSLAITGSITADNKPYDATTAATIATRTLTGVLGTDNVSYVGGSATFADKNVGAGKTVTATGLSLNGTDAGNYTVNTTATTTADITTRALHVTATAASKLYNGTTSAIATLSDDREPSDVLTVNYTSATFDTKNVGTGKTVTVSGISISGTDSGNYTFNTSTTALADITARALTVSAHGIDKVYDGTTSATVTLSDDKVSGDYVTDSYTSAAFADKNVGNGKTVSVSGISISGADAGNYTFNTTASTTANITARSLTVSATGISKVYDATTVATVTLSDNRVSGDSVTDAYTGASFADKNVGTGKPVGVSGISISGTDAGNYSLANTTANTTANITKRDLTVSATGVNKVYDGNTTATVTLSDDEVSGDSVTDAYTGASFADKNVGNGKAVSVSGISISGTDAGNYNLLNTTADTTANITARSLTVSATGISKVYDATTVATVTLSDNRVSGDSVTDAYTGASFADKNVGTGKPVGVSGISISGTDAGNYHLVNMTVTTSADITARALAITATGVNKTYDGTTTATVTLLDNRVSGDVFTDTYSSASFANKNVGTGKPVSVSGISISGTDAGNYTFNTSTSTSADISARALTITAHGVNKVYDGTAAAAVTLSDDRVTGDVFTDSYASATFNNKNVAAGKPVGVSGISIGGTDAGNYTFNNTANAIADITARPLTISATGINKGYDGNTTATVALSDNRVSGDVFTDSYTGATFNSKNVGTAKPVSVGGISISGTDAGDYTFNTTASTTADITTRSMTITATGVNKVYDGTATATVSLSDDRVTGDVFNDSYGSATFADANVGTAKTVGVTGISLSGTDAGNYNFNTTASTTANITKNPTTTAITVPPASSTIVVGSTLSITALVQGYPPLVGTPDGTVQFKDGAANLGLPAAVASGLATLSTTTLPLGSHTITAIYSGSGNFFGSSTTASITVVVIPSINITFLPPLAGQPVGNKIKVGQVVPHKVDLVNSLGQSVTSGVTVKLKVLGVDTSSPTGIFQDVIEDANGVGNDGTVTSDGIMAYTGGHWQFNLDTSNFSDPNTYSESAKYYTSTVSVIDNATMLTVGTWTINLETGK